MSSSNLVSLTYVKETTYGEKPSPLSGVTLKTARFTSESLSGTPLTTESQELRSDRMSSGQVVTGLDVGGAIDFELAKDAFFDDFFEAGMMSTWVADETLNTSVVLTPDGGDDQLATLTLGAAFANLDPGVLAKFTPTGADPVIVSIISVDTPDTVFTVATEKGQAAVSETLDVILPAHLDIGETKGSFLAGKAYTDVETSGDDNSQTYLGKLVSGFSINSEYGQIVKGAFNLLGNGYVQESPSFAEQVVTAGGSVTAAGTTAKLNASIDVPLVTSDGAATTFCIENFSIEMDNGLQAQNCIGKAAPTDYTLGTASISINASIYLSSTSYAAFMPGKLSQTPVSLTFAMINDDGGYAFHLPAVQLSFPDPSAGGQNQQTMLEASGVAKVGTGAIASALRVYKL